jgi:hypothetical protein
MIDQNILTDMGEFPLVRCKIGCLDSNQFVANKTNDWHKDETPYEVLRVIVPLMGNESYRFQMENQPDCWLEPGNVYVFDQSYYHRVFIKNASIVPRIHLILSFVTWFDKSDSGWIPNSYCGKIHPLDLFDKINL